MYDLEGIVMADALRTCSTIDDFEHYIKKNLGPQLGCWTNFCVIDAHGGASIFEVHNHGYVRLEANEEPGSCLLNTNFSRSGVTDEGAGYLRFDRESALFGQVPEGMLSHEFVLQTAARDVGHSLLRTPERSEWNQISPDTAYWIHANHTINRASTASVILVHGVRAGEDPRMATLWVILGEPVCSIAIPLWVEAGRTPPQLHEGADAPLSREAARLKKILRPLTGADRGEYIDLTRLDNSEGTGWLPLTLGMERKILQSTRELLTKDPTDSTLARFQLQMAAKALTTLKSIK